MRPDTPPRQTATGIRVTVKQYCERCGRCLGDATREEIARAVNGVAPLPVAAECGCADRVLRGGPW